MRSWNALLVLAVAVAPAYAQRAVDAARAAPGHTCTPITQANADASAGAVNIHHDGTAIAGTRRPTSRAVSAVSRDRLNPGSRRRSSASLNAPPPRRGERRHSLHAVRAVNVPSAEASTPRSQSARTQYHAAATDPVRRHHGPRRATRIHRRRADGIQPVELVGEPDRNGGRDGGRRSPAVTSTTPRPSWPKSTR